MEKLMQYVWQHRLWLQQDMRTTDGRVVQVIDPGLLNTDAGPDFFNAKVKIGEEMWVGNIEIHVKASDWFRHHHDQDPAYDSVVLHVVGKDDMPICRKNGMTIPQLRMPCSPEFRTRYDEFVNRADTELPCSAEIDSISPLHLCDWLCSLAHERMHGKVSRIQKLLEHYNGNWEEACYVIIARCLGFGINGDAFERLAYSLPLRLMSKHSDSILSIEALLFGQARLLESAPDGEPYIDSLKAEYLFLSNKFSLKPPIGLGWKMARMRPANLPHRRIAMLAAMIHGGFRMMSRIVESTTADDARHLFDFKLTGYWEHHYNFEAVSPQPLRTLSDMSINTLVINAVAPLLYAHGYSRNDMDTCDRALDLLQSLPSERNSIVDLFGKAGVKSKDAFTSQALIQLRREYCEKRKCLYCRIGHRMLAAKVRKQE